MLSVATSFTLSLTCVARLQSLSRHSPMPLSTSRAQGMGRPCVCGGGGALLIPPTLLSTPQRNLATDGDEEHDYRVGFYNMSTQISIRDLRSDKVARLLAFSGTVTRTSEVRPELVEGLFVCEACGAQSYPVPQQFKYLEPTKCCNVTCPNRTGWKLNHAQHASRFADWQRLRVQENASEIPAGSMPRTLEVILRGELVERAKAGDDCVFVGSLIVIPDVAQLAAPGERVEAVTRVDTHNPTDGVQGLKALGCRELTYRLAFLASSCRPADRHSGFINIRDEDTVMDSFTALEKDDLFRMKATPNIYSKLASSIAPAVYGHEEIKRGVLLMLLGGVHKVSPTGTKASYPRQFSSLSLDV